MVMAAVESAGDTRSLTILGSTGSVGCSTVSLIEAERERYVVEAITANRNVAKLADQARRLRPGLAVIADESRYADLKDALAGTGIAIAAGASGLLEAAAMPAERVMAAIVGAAGLAPTLASVRRGATVALANKECLVCAGELMLGEVARHGARLLPVDSEHNAIFQVFDFEQPERIEKIILTASGGPFRSADKAAMAAATPQEAVTHPNWDMGAKISVDSATMMNKGLEMIEALHLFPIASEQIEVLIHPQSVVHSMVAYCDGSVLAQLGSPDMRTPIAYSLAWPRRMAAPVPRLDLAAIANLSFEAPDEERFPALRLANAALRS
ncbi:MAG: 1-deoxy-D-xylulose-5-phosphate reductoisomerase, partial [Alphaproteobacteria bacterium]|nr:1-deoxy-D-xylulose-5-phosphate reductoisomerase [Alphaproteobacteria bacterium]